jgi:hypothetical protein
MESSDPFSLFHKKNLKKKEKRKNKFGINFFLKIIKIKNLVA